MSDPYDFKKVEQEKRDNELKLLLQQQQEHRDLQWLMSSEEGRRIVWRLLSTAGVFQTTFNVDAIQMAFNEGFRHYGTTMLAEILTTHSDLYQVMVKEQDDGK